MLDLTLMPPQNYLMSTVADFMQIEMQNEVSLMKKGEELILAVEPDAAIRAKISEALAAKFKILFALNGKQALDILQKHHPQTIITETGLPVLDGAALLTALKADPALEKIPFLVLTEEQSQDVRIRFLENGANDYVLKPFSPQELLARISNLSKLRKFQLSLQEGLQAARTIQHALMPQPQMDLKNARFEYLYNPCDELSGDFLDLIQTETSVYIYVADVTSHGTASAQVTYLLKGLFREAINTVGSSNLSDILRHVGNGYAALRLEHGIGLRAIQFNPKTKELTTAGSNSPDPLIFSGDELVHISKGAGPMIDAELWVDEPFPLGTVQLKTGDYFYVFTDGCMEFPLPNGKQMGFMKFIAILRDAPARTWRTTVMDSLALANGSRKFPDDITIARLEIL